MLAWLTNAQALLLGTIGILTIIGFFGALSILGGVHVDDIDRYDPYGDRWAC